jgi:hypothetical protein
MIIWILNSIVLASLCFGIYKASSQNPLRSYFFPALLFKLSAGIAVGLLYKYYYNQQGDTFSLFHLASYLSGLVPTQLESYLKIIFLDEYDPKSKTIFFVWNQPRAMYFVKLLSIVNIFTDSNYWLSSIYLSLFSFYGNWKLAGYLSRTYFLPTYLTALAFLFFPSFVFWTSGVLKESIMSGIIALLIVAVLQLVRNESGRFKNLLIIAIGFYVLFYLKYYYAAMAGTVLLAFAFSYLLKVKYQLKKSLQVSLFFLSMILMFFGVSWLHPNMHLDYFPVALFTNYIATLNLQEVPDYLFHNYTPNWSGIFRNLSQAIYIGFFEPGIWSAKPNLQVFAALENLFLLVICTTTVLYRIYIRHFRISPEAIALLTYLIISAAFMALASPNYGSLIRYKTGYLPFLVLAIGYLNPALEYFFLTSEISRKDR